MWSLIEFDNDPGAVERFWIGAWHQTLYNESLFDNNYGENNVKGRLYGEIMYRRNSTLTKICKVFGERTFLKLC